MSPISTADRGRSVIDSSGAHLASKHELPDYEPLKFTPTDETTDGVASLISSIQWTELDTILIGLLDTIPGDAAEINERLTERRVLTAGVNDRRRRGGDLDLECHQTREAEMHELGEQVESMTKRMDLAMRRAIDGNATLKQLHDALRTARLRAGPSTQQSTLDVTQPGCDGEALPSFAQTFAEELDHSEEQYYAKSLYTRYGEHNSYINFKQHVHTAQYPTDQAPPVPAASTWFLAPGEEPLPGLTGASQGASDSDNEDIQISRAHISTRCAITLQEFQNPVQSSKCNHSFERHAIMQMINQQSPRGRRAVQRRAVKCPMPGCSQLLSAEDLTTDALLIRKIKRIQRMKQLEREQGLGQNGGHDGGDGEEIVSDSDKDIDNLPARQHQPARVKAEAVSQSVRGNPLDETSDGDLHMEAA